MRRSMMMASVLAVAFAMPAFAQQTVDQPTRQQVEAMVMKFVDVTNKGDGQAGAAMYGPNPINITANGKSTTAAQIQSGIEAVHKRGLTLSAKVDDVAPLFGGQGVVATAPYTGVFANDPGSPHIQGNFLFVLEHAGDGWKIRIFTASRSAPAPPAR
jgi:hypothetical protein